MIPKTTTFREYKEKKSKSAKANASLSTGQTTLDGSRSLPSRPADVVHVEEEHGEVDELSEDETSGRNVADYRRMADRRTGSDVAHAHHEPKAHPGGDESEDIEMG